MQHPLPDLGEWPSLEWEQWKDTAETLHMYMQIVGKTRLALTPLQNHWWNIPLYLTARGLSTSAMPADGGRLLDIEFDFVSHELVCRTSDGEIRKIPLRPVPVQPPRPQTVRRLLAQKMEERPSRPHHRPSVRRFGRGLDLLAASTGSAAGDL